MGKVKYVVVGRGNPQDKLEEKKYYACAKSSDEITLEELSSLIEKNCTLTSTDVMAVLNATDEAIREYLSKGMIVRIGNLGHVRLALSSKGALSPEQFTSANITRAKVVFTPSKATKKALKVLEYEKYRPKDETKEGEEEDTDTSAEG